MMSSELYNVFFDGVVEGQDVAEVKVAFAQLFRVEIEKIEKFFSSSRTVIKSNIDADAAEKYIAKLATIGVVASKDAVEAKPPVSEMSLEPIAPNADSRVDVNSSESNAAFIPPESTNDTSFVSAQIRRVPFVFTGKGFEYFKIWIVNILLSIVTLGIYSAWAKVRNKQYFYGNTSFDGASFEYTAEPLKILKGRIVAVVFFVAYSIATKTSPMLALVFILLLFVFTPWIVVNSLRFNARHSSYRNINFRFVGSMGGAAKAFIAWPLAGLFSFGLLLPVAWKRQAAYVTNNHVYGNESFDFDVSVKEYYKMLLVLVGATVVFFVVIGALIGSSLAGLASKDPAMVMQNLLTMIPAFIAYLAFYLFVAAYFVSTMANIHFKNTRLAAHQFDSNWSVVSYAMLLLTNTLGILCTLGLFIPFAKIRTAAYKAAHTEVVVSGDLEGFIAAELEQSNSLGEGVHDIFDIDISL